MSLAEQSQQWFPTSVQVTVHQARNLRVKGKNGTNDAYAIIQVAKDKFSTSVAEKCVAPVWKEEASFDLPLFHPGNTERCTLYIIVMHRAQVGLDKFLGQAVVNLLTLHDNKGREKTDWFKLVDKTGKEDKARGEVLLHIQFMRNNMSASMFDLSMQDKPRSRISKLKDKVRRKKKDGFSDSVSAIVPSVSHVLTDSEGEADAQSLSQFPGVKKKSKLKNLFAPKSNLQRNISQSMSTLGTLPEKNSSLSGSRSSGLNIDSPEVKKKFKFLGHKRTGSSDSKVSQGPFSLLGRSKQSNSDLNNLCINGSHVYTEEADPKSGSTLSLNSSGQGSVEDVQKHTSEFSADSFKSVPVPSYRHESTDRAILEQQRHQEEERRQAEERRVAEERRQEEDEKYRLEAKRQQEEQERRYQEEQERKRRILEDEARRKKQKEEEEEEKRQMQEEEHRIENQRLEEECRKAEEQKRQEEASMSERLSSLFGIIRKKEEKKEEVQQDPTEDAHHTGSRDFAQLSPHRSTNPFEDNSLSSDLTVSSSESPADHQKSSHNPQTPSAMVFLNRTAKVSAVKPRLAPSLESEPADSQTLSHLCPSPLTSDSTYSSVPAESPDNFSNLHSSLAQTLFGSPFGSTEDLSSVESLGSSPTMTDKKRRAPQPPLFGTETGGNCIPTRELKNPAYVEADESQQDKKISLPLPDYDTLFPQKRHGVQGHTRWDHIIAEVNQRHRDAPPELLGPEMSVDGPQEFGPRQDSLLESFIPQEGPATRHYQKETQETKPMSTKKFAAPAPPKPGTPTSHMDTAPPQDQWKMKEAPTAKPRQKVSNKDPTQQGDYAETPHKVTSSDQALFSQSKSSMNKIGWQTKENLRGFPNTELLSRDQWAHHKQNQETNNLFTSNIQIEQKPEDQGMTNDDLNKIFSQDKPSDPFASLNGSGTNRNNENKKRSDDSKEASFHIFQRKNSQRQKHFLQSKTHSDDKGVKSREEPGSIKTAAIGGLPTRDLMNESVTHQPQDDMKTQSSFYGREKTFGDEPLTSSEPLQLVMEESAGGLAGGKTLAWVSPSEVQSVNAHNSNGGGLALTPRRPHPVKPLTSVENTSTQVVKEIKGWDSTPGRIKVADSEVSGPYTQLTQEELITLVVKQQTDLSRKDAKIVELEEYIDNLVLRVIEEKPSILLAASQAKPL